MTINTPRGDLEFTLTDARVDKLGRVALGTIVDGYVRNLTPVDVNYLKFELVYLDQDGKPLDVCNVIGNLDGICALMVFDTIPSGGTVALRDPGNHITPGKHVPKKRVISGFATRLIEALYSPHYSFDAKTKEVPQFDASFDLSVEGGITFVLKNKSESPIEVLWDQSSFINEAGESSRLVHGGVKYIDKDRSQPNTLIPPLAKLSETVYPSDYIEFSVGKWRKRPLLPANLNISQDVSSLDSLVGKSLRLYLRLLIEENKVDYVVSFPITSVRY